MKVIRIAKHYFHPRTVMSLYLRGDLEIDPKRKRRGTLDCEREKLIND